MAAVAVGLWVAGAQAQQARAAAARPAAVRRAPWPSSTPTKDSTARGEVTFTQEAGGVHVVGSFAGPRRWASMASTCTRRATARRRTARRPAGTSTRRPSRTAAREAAERHVGDLGNFKVDPYSLGRVDFVDPMLSLSGPNSILRQGA